MYFCFIFMFLILLLEWFYKLSRQFSPAGLLPPQDGDRKWRTIFCRKADSERSSPQDGWMTENQRKGISPSCWITVCIPNLICPWNEPFGAFCVDWYINKSVIGDVKLCGPYGMYFAGVGLCCRFPSESLMCRIPPDLDQTLRYFPTQCKSVCTTRCLYELFLLQPTLQKSLGLNEFL